MNIIWQTFDIIGLSKGSAVMVLFTSAVVALGFMAPDLLIAALGYAVTLAPIWLPILLSVFLWKMWIWYIRAEAIANEDTALLEVRVPRDIMKSPRAMDLFFSGIHTGMGESTFIDRWVYGKTRPWYSFELVSIEGQIHFYIWTRRFLKDLIEAQLYAEYPEVEIYEVDDYTFRLPFSNDAHSVWGCDFKLGGSDAIPIKTYVDYELDKDPKEEYKVDPIAHVFEYLSSLGRGEQAWIQILIRQDKDKRTKPGTWSDSEDRWSAEIKEAIKKMRDDITPTWKDKEGVEHPGFPAITPMWTETVKSIERNANKPAFDTGIRGIYVAEKESFKGIRIAGLVGVFKQFGSGDLNSLAPTRWFAGDFSYPWQDYHDIRKRSMSKQIIDAYRRRSWFHPPYQTPYYVMTTEELATIYHFPSRTVEAPGLIRIPSTKAGAPPNLPT